MNKFSTLKVIVIALVLSLLSPVYASSLNDQLGQLVGKSLTSNTLSFSTSWYSDLLSWLKNLKSIANNKKGTQSGNDNPKDAVSVAEPQTWLLFTTALLGLAGLIAFRKKSN